MLKFGVPKLLLDFKISVVKGMQSVLQLLNYLELLINERMLNSPASPCMSEHSETWVSYCPVLIAAELPGTV